jgi:hypothetical protein
MIKVLALIEDIRRVHYRVLTLSHILFVVCFGIYYLKKRGEGNARS